LEKERKEEEERLARVAEEEKAVEEAKKKERAERKAKRAERAAEHQRRTSDDLTLSKKPRLEKEMEILVSLRKKFGLMGVLELCGEFDCQVLPNPHERPNQKVR
jgi:hypothetical protein